MTSERARTHKPPTPHHCTIVVCLAQVNKCHGLGFNTFLQRMHKQSPIKKNMYKFLCNLPCPTIQQVDDDLHKIVVARNTPAGEVPAGPAATVHASDIYVVTWRQCLSCNHAHFCSVQSIRNYGSLDQHAPCHYENYHVAKYFGITFSIHQRMIGQCLPAGV